MSQNYERLKTLLKELFQLDQPDRTSASTASCTPGAPR